MQSEGSSYFSPNNLDTQRLTTEKNWNEFLSNPHDNHIGTRNLIHESWQRCLSTGVNPSLHRTAITLNSHKIKEVIQLSDLYEHATPILYDLSQHVKDTNHLVTLADAKGRILFVDGNRQTLGNAEKMNFVLGANWSEQAIGTNAIGTSLTLKHSVQVFAAEHFCEGVHNWVCASTPIFEPITKEVLGVIDITGIWRNAQTHTLGMTVMAAQAIQNKLLQQSLEFHSHIQNEFIQNAKRYPNDGIIAIDAAFRIVEANGRAHNIVRNRTGRELFDVWAEQTFHSYMLNIKTEAGQVQAGDIMIHQICMKALIREIKFANRRIGFILVLKPQEEKTSSKDTSFLTPQKNAWSSLIGQSSTIQSAIKKCDIAAKTDVPILLQGESGTGKERFARAIHETSPRRNGPFIAMNCGAVPKELIASELFGFEGGTFTGATKQGRQGKFEAANGGTLFLDEIEEMGPEFQVHLLRVLQEKEVVHIGSAKPISLNVRIIAATNKNIEELIANGSFRADLYYRLSVVNVAISPLRDRRGDIPLFIQSVLSRLADESHIHVPTVDSELFHFLTNIYPWPGNVRELENVFTHALLFRQSDTITFHDLPSSIQRTYEPKSPGQNKDRKITDKFLSDSSRSQHDSEEIALIQLLKKSNGNLSEVSRKLGIARTTLYRRLRKHGLL